VAAPRPKGGWFKAAGTRTIDYRFFCQPAPATPGRTDGPSGTSPYLSIHLTGEPFRLLEFQREVIRGIYSDPSYWAAVKLVVKKKRAA
jgi:hypothetical protein